jgi:hypothetical protein
MLNFYTICYAQCNSKISVNLLAQKLLVYKMMKWPLKSHRSKPESLFLSFPEVYIQTFYRDIHIDWIMTFWHFSAPTPFPLPLECEIFIVSKIIMSDFNVLNDLNDGWNSVFKSLFNFQSFNFTTIKIRVQRIEKVWWHFLQPPFWVSLFVWNP